MPTPPVRILPVAGAAICRVRVARNEFWVVDSSANSS